MTRTGVFATKEEAAKCAELAKQAARTPVIALSMAHGLNEGGFSGQAWTHCYKTVHACALYHGLPEIKGYYGMDTSTGEFVYE